MPNDHASTIWNYFMKKIRNAYGVAGLMGNLQAESGLYPDRVQGDIPYSSFSQEYTAKVDNGIVSESEFVNNGPNGGGYGLAQWTYPARKQALYDMYKTGSYSSIGSVTLACEYLWYELRTSYSGVLNTLRKANSVREASDSVLHDFENPADQSTSVEKTRANMGQLIYIKYSDSYKSYEDVTVIEKAVSWCEDIAADDTHGYSQEDRWGPDYDCASLLISGWEYAGLKVRDAGAGYTGNFYEGFTKCGFNDVTALINFETGEGLMRGDILLNPDWHVEMMVSPTERVGAHSDYDGATGDSSGNEINIKPYANYATYGWTYCLRYGSGYYETPPTQTEKKKFNLILFATASE